MRRRGGGEEGDDGIGSSRSGGSRSRVGRPHKAPKLAAKPGGQPLAAKPVPAKQAAAQVDACVAAQAGAMREWQKRAVAVEGDVLLLQGKLQEAEQRATAGPGPPPGAGPQTQAEGGRAGAAARRADGRGGGGRGGGGGRYDVPYGGEPGLESLDREGEGGALSSGRHRAPAAFLEGRADLRVGGAGVSSCLGQP